MSSRIAPLTLALFLASLAVTACTNAPEPALQAPLEPHDHSTHAHTTFDAGLPLVEGVPVDAKVSFKIQVAPVLWQHCGACHTSGGAGAGAVEMFTALGEPQYPAIRSHIGQILLEIQTGRMPAGKPNSVPAAQFNLIDVWSASGMPNN